MGRLFWCGNFDVDCSSFKKFVGSSSEDLITLAEDVSKLSTSPDPSLVRRGTGMGRLFGVIILMWIIVLFKKFV